MSNFFPKKYKFRYRGPIQYTVHNYGIRRLITPIMILNSPRNVNETQDSCGVPLHLIFKQLVKLFVLYTPTEPTSITQKIV